MACRQIRAFCAEIFGGRSDGFEQAPGLRQSGDTPTVLSCLRADDGSAGMFGISRGSCPVNRWDARGDAHRSAQRFHVLASLLNQSEASLHPSMPGDQRLSHDARGVSIGRGRAGSCCRPSVAGRAGCLDWDDQGARFRQDKKRPAMTAGRPANRNPNRSDLYPVIVFRANPVHPSWHIAIPHHLGRNHPGPALRARMLVVISLVTKACTCGLGELLCHRTFPPFLEIPKIAKSGNDIDSNATVNSYLREYFHGFAYDSPAAG